MMITQTAAFNIKLNKKTEKPLNVCLVTMYFVPEHSDENL